MLLISSLTASLGQVFFKMSQGSFLSLFFFSGLFLYGLSTLLWVYALKFLPLSKVYPFTFLTFALVLILSYVLFNERLSLINLTGVVLIVIGVILAVL